MTIKFGRAGQDITIRNPSSVSVDGETVTFAGSFAASDAHEMKALRMNFASLKNEDEPVIPVVYSYDSDFDGYYRVLSTSFNQDPGQEKRFTAFYTVQLERLFDYALPAMESILLGGFRENAHAIATGAPSFTITKNALGLYVNDGVAHTDWVGTRVTTDGDLGVISNGSPTAAVRRLAQFTVKPADYYIGAAAVEITYNSNYRKIIGRRIPSGLSAVGWRLTNGLIRITPSSTAGRIGISCWDGSAWDTAKDFKFATTRAASIIDRFQTFSIIRNTPEEVVVRLTMGDNITGTAADIERHVLDISLKRGLPIAEFYWQSDNAVLGTVQRDTAEASTAVTGGIRATANDASGNRFAMFTPVAKTNDLVQGGFTTNAAATAFAFGIGLAVAGGSATAYNATTDLADMYFAPWSEYMAVVGK